MVKRKVTQVDEAKIRQMIAGDAPVESPGQKPASSLEKENADVKADTSETLDGKIPVEEKCESVKEKIQDEYNNSKTGKRKKDKSGYYKDIFLINNRKPAARRQTTLQLSETTYRKITKLLKVTDGVSLAVFIDNMLQHHFEEYKDEIEEIQRTYMMDFLK